MKLSTLPTDVLSVIYNNNMVDHLTVSSLSRESRQLVQQNVNKLKMIRYNTTVNQFNLLQEFCTYIPVFNLTTIYFDNNEWYIELDN
jgi:hypothetical protein